ncbi:MAG: hypothetical protein ACT4N2_09285 [Hyphomicrobium sp.]
MRARTAPLVVLALALALLAVRDDASATRLGKEACDALRTEETGLVTAGVKTEMEKGPDWAKSNLAPDRLQQIARLIEVEEQLSFRCKVIAGPVRKKGQRKPAGVKAAVPAVDRTTTDAKPTDPGKSAGAPAGSAAADPKPMDVGSPPAAPPSTKPTVIRLKPAAENSAAEKPATVSKPVPKRRPASAAKQNPAQKPGLFFFD